MIVCAGNFMMSSESEQKRRILATRILLIILMTVILEFNKIWERELDETRLNKVKKLEEIVPRAEKTWDFYHVYRFAPSLFMHSQIFTLSTADTSHLCDGGAKFKIKPARYSTSTVFMSILKEAWIRFSENEVKYTEFKFERMKNPDGGKQFYYIKSVDYPKYYLTMGFLNWWMRAKFYDDQPIDNDAIWDIRCLKTEKESFYFLVPKESLNFACVDCTGRLKGSYDFLDISKMFLFEKV